MSTMEGDGPSRRTLLSRYLHDVRMLAPLTRQQSAAPDGPPCYELVEANLAFVFQVARRYVGLGLSFEDLISEGNLGLLEAARHFDPARGTKFITYAVWWIRKAILAALSQQTSSIRLPHTQRRKIHLVLEAQRAISAETCGDTGREAIARRLNTSIERIDQILQVRGPELSLDQAMHAESDTPIHESLPDRMTPDPEDALLGDETRARIRRGLSELGPRERHVLSGRFGLGDEPCRSLRQIGQELGLTREAIRLIEERAKKKLRRIIDGRPARPGARFLCRRRSERLRPRRSDPVD